MTAYGISIDLDSPSYLEGARVANWGGSKRQVRRVRDEMRAAGVNPDLAYCTECGEWYNVLNRAAVDRHAH